MSAQDKDNESKELVKRFKAGDKAAMGRLYDLHHVAVKKLVKSRLDEAHKQDREDFYQTIWEKIIEATDRYDETRFPSFIAWLVVVVRNNVVDELRRESDEASLEKPDRVADEGDEPVSELADKAARVKRIKRAVAALPDKQREAVLLYYFGGKSYAEIADETGATVRAVKARLHDALESLPAFFLDEVG